MSIAALIVGSSGIVGSASATLLIEEGWQVTGLARRPVHQPGVTPLATDLLDPSSLAEALRATKPSHVFIATWLRQPTEAENIRVNAAMVRNLLDALRPAGSVRHVALVTGLKHYLGPFDSYGKGALPQTPFREEQGRLDVANFYYAQEDKGFAAAVRPLAGGWANAAAVCAALGAVPASAAPDTTRLISPWHTDAALGRPIGVVTDMSKSRRLGFTAYQPTDDAFFDLFKQLRR